MAAVRHFIKRAICIAANVPRPLSLSFSLIPRSLPFLSPATARRRRTVPFGRRADRDEHIARCLIKNSPAELCCDSGALRFARWKYSDREHRFSI